MKQLLERLLRLERLPAPPPPPAPATRADWDIVPETLTFYYEVLGGTRPGETLPPHVPPGLSGEALERWRRVMTEAGLQHLVPPDEGGRAVKALDRMLRRLERLPRPAELPEKAAQDRALTPADMAAFAQLLGLDVQADWAPDEDPDHAGDDA
jgi:hypothetical protein